MMNFRRKNFHYFLILMLILGTLLHTSYAWPRKSISGNQGLRRPPTTTPRATREKERMRLLRLLISPYIMKRIRHKGKPRFGSELPSPENFYDDRDFEFGLEDLPTERKQWKPNARKRVDKIDIDEFHHGNEIDTNSTQSCCPQKFEIIEPSFGRNRSGHMVQLYKDERIQQRFYELICDPNIAHKPCKFLEGRNQRMSKCTQQHAYTYGLVRSDKSLSGWSLDHIRIRSGCVCKIFQSSRRKKNSRKNKV